MSYRNSILFRPSDRYPFMLCTEADGIPMTVSEVEMLHAECERALNEFDAHELMKTENENDHAI